MEKSSLFYPNERAKVTIRPCEILFNKNGSSKYIFKDDWKEIATINNNTGNNSIDLSYSKKIITKEGVNKSDFNNFSEETRCFKNYGTRAKQRKICEKEAKQRHKKLIKGADKKMKGLKVIRDRGFD